MSDETTTDPGSSGTAVGRVISVAAVLVTLGAIFWAADGFRAIGLLLYPEQFLGGMLALAIPLVFLTFRANRERTFAHIPWYDYVAAVAGFFASAYLAVRYPVLAELIFEEPIDGLVTGAVIIVLALEGLRRTVGHVMFFIVVGFVVLGLVGQYIPGALQGRYVPLGTMIYTLAWDNTSMLGLPLKIVTTIITAYIFFGQVLLRSGGSEFFTQISMVLVGRYRGGQAKIAVIASGLFGSISGSAVSNVATTGVLTIPLMKGAGYKAEQAGAIEAVASTGGQLMPPIMGAAAFLMAEWLEIPYTDVMLAALIPAVLYYFALFILADLAAARLDIKRIPREDIPNAWPVLKSGWMFPIPFIVLIGTLFWLNYSPEWAAMLASASILVLGMVFGYKGKRLTVRDIVDSVRGTGLAVLDIFMIGAGAGIIIGVLGLSGLGFGLSLLLVQLGEGNVIVLLLVSAGICILLGMGMPTAGVYLLLAPLVAPSLIEVGFDKIASHLFILYFGMMSMITPPVAIAAFAAASLAGAEAMKTGFAAVKFGWFAYLVPFLFIGSPGLLMNGGAVTIILVAVSAAVGVWLVCIAVMGYFLRPVGALERLLYAVIGLVLLVPVDKIVAGLSNDVAELAGVAVAAILVGREIMLKRRAVAR